MNRDTLERPMIKFDNEHDRRTFLKYAALVGVGGTLAATMPIADVFAAGDDVGILNYALTLEYLESEFYQKGLAANILGDDSKYITPIAAHEKAHVAAITATLKKLGATPVAKPTFVFPATTFTDKATFLTTAVTFEETGVKAYQGQVTLIKSGAILGAAASIAGVESRHAAVLNYLAQTPPVPNPVEQMATMDETLATVKPFLGA